MLLAHVSPSVYIIMLTFMAACAATLVALVTGVILAQRGTTRILGRRLLAVAGVFAVLELGVILFAVYGM